MISKLPLDNSYALLMIFLAPLKSDHILSMLLHAAHYNQIHWEKLLYQANIQLCTPLWYSQLKKDNILDCLPSDLVEYLAEIYQANKERNQQLQSALIDLLSEMNAASIDTLLLKGAATFCDKLYDDLGSRVMGDLDILVPLNKVEQSRTILEGLGYKEIPDEGMELEGLPTDERHHQLPRYFIPDTPIVVEIHFKLSYALVGRMIPADKAWKAKTKTTIMGQKTSVLSADHKLLLNTGHALIPHREYLKGKISLLQLTEFTLLAQRYADSINWNFWIDSARQFSLLKEFTTYLNLSASFMSFALPNEIKFILHSRYDERRILFIGEYEATLEPDTLQFYSKTTYFFYQLYYLLKLPLWMWRNPCYASGWKNVPVRLLVFIGKCFSRRSWKKI